VEQLGIDPRFGGDARVVLLELAVDVVGGAGAGEAQHVVLAADGDLVVAVGQAADALDLRKVERGAGELRDRGERAQQFVALGG
jgi:hypothetical protein